MEDIKLQIINGNWKDAVRLVAHSKYLFTDVMQSIMDDEFMSDSDALTLLKVALSVGFLQEHFDYES